MTRRIAVLMVGSVLLLVFGLVGAAAPVPYVAQVPGPTYNTLGSIGSTPIISVSGRRRNEVRGNLNLTTVGVSRHRLTLVQAVRGWFERDVSVVPEEAVYPPDHSQQQTQQANREAFLTSEQAAQAAALAHLGYPRKVVVQDVSAGAPAEGALQKGDAIESVDGRATPSTDTLTGVLTGLAPGSRISVAYTRLGVPGTAVVTTKAASERPGSLLGVVVRQQPSAPFDIDIQVADVGGPSAGLMLSLGVVYLVGDRDLTGGRVIAGTGTIDADGKVGPIGGIQLKMVAAKEISAQLFLVPAGNCAEAKGAPDPGFPLARVASLDDALTALGEFQAGRRPAAC